MDLDAARRFAGEVNVETVTGMVEVGDGAKGGGGTVVVAVSRLVWFVGGDDRRMLIELDVAEICLTVGRAVLLALLIGCCCWGEVVMLGILFSSEGFWRAKVFRRAAMLAGLEI